MVILCRLHVILHHHSWSITQTLMVYHANNHDLSRKHLWSITQTTMIYHANTYGPSRIPPITHITHQPSRLSPMNRASPEEGPKRGCRPDELSPPRHRRKPFSVFWGGGGAGGGRSCGGGGGDVNGGGDGGRRRLWVCGCLMRRGQGKKGQR